MEVCRDCQAETYQDEQGGDGVDDEDRGQAMSGGRRELEVFGGIAREEALCRRQDLSANGHGQSGRESERLVKGHLMCSRPQTA